jgi:hypothetical protein
LNRAAHAADAPAEGAANSGGDRSGAAERAGTPAGLNRAAHAADAPAEGAANSGGDRSGAAERAGTPAG